VIKGIVRRTGVFKPEGKMGRQAGRQMERIRTPVVGSNKRGGGKSGSHRLTRGDKKSKKGHRVGLEQTG